MVNTIKAFDARHMKPTKKVPALRLGNTVDMNMKTQEDSNSRIQAFTGVVVVRKGVGVCETLVVRKVSFDTGVEHRFPMHSSSIDSIGFVCKGHMRRAKLYYLCALRDKATRTAECCDNLAK